MKGKIPPADFKKTSYPGVIYLESERGKTYYIRYRDPSGKGHFEKAKGMTTPAKANQLRMSKITGNALPNEDQRAAQRAAKAADDARWTFDKLWEAWKADDDNKDKRGTTKADCRYRLHIQPKFGSREPKDIKAIVSVDGKQRHTEIDVWRNELRKHYARETTKSIISLLTRIARYGASKGYCPGLPFPIILRGKPLGADPRHKRAPNPNERARFLLACRRWPNRQEGRFMLFIAHTGIRRGSVQRLTWADVDLPNRTAILRDSKTGDVAIYLSNKAARLLRSHPRTGEYVFAGENGMLAQRQIDRMPRKIADAAGWPADLDPCHSWRRNLASRLNDNGHGIKTIQSAGGWKSPQMVLLYTSVSEKTVRDAINGL